jgi:hypothetical protein
VYVQLPWGPWIFRRETGPILYIIAQKFQFHWLLTLWTWEFLTGTCVYKMLNFSINMYQTTAFWRYTTNVISQSWRLQYQLCIPYTVAYCCHIVVPFGSTTKFWLDIKEDRCASVSLFYRKIQCWEGSGALRRLASTDTREAYMLFSAFSSSQFCM